MKQEVRAELAWGQRKGSLFTMWRSLGFGVAPEGWGGQLWARILVWSFRPNHRQLQALPGRPHRGRCSATPDWCTARALPFSRENWGPGLRPLPFPIPRTPPSPILLARLAFSPRCLHLGPHYQGRGLRHLPGALPKPPYHRSLAKRFLCFNSVLFFSSPFTCSVPPTIPPVHKEAGAFSSQLLGMRWFPRPLALAWSCSVAGDGNGTLWGLCLSFCLLLALWQLVNKGLVVTFSLALCPKWPLQHLIAQLQGCRQISDVIRLALEGSFWWVRDKFVGSKHM